MKTPGSHSKCPVPGGAQLPQDEGLPRKLLGVIVAASKGFPCREPKVHGGSSACRCSELPTRKALSGCLGSQEHTHIETQAEPYEVATAARCLHSEGELHPGLRDRFAWPQSGTPVHS